jgi:hypothetical protein
MMPAKCRPSPQDFKGGVGARPVPRLGREVGIIVIGPRASLRAHDQAHSYARISAQGCARSNDTVMITKIDPECVLEAVERQNPEQREKATGALRYALP